MLFKCFIRKEFCITITALHYNYKNTKINLLLVYCTDSCLIVSFFEILYANVYIICKTNLDCESR